MKYYYCDVRKIIWSQLGAITDADLTLQYATIELTKDEYNIALESGEVKLNYLPTLHITDEYLDALCMPEPDSSTLH